MRFEAKHSFMKQCVTKCFKNVSKTLANRHQRYMCWNLLKMPGQIFTNFLYDGDIVPPGNHNVNLKEHLQINMIRESAKIPETDGPIVGSRFTEGTGQRKLAPPVGSKKLKKSGKHAVK
ncbi:uncharacterized protein LOC114539300 [Dendronephthya gigantea]|uniref:uncharacterized protein LOC114537970 n=1 Tax=Dendronephthya gigantea TaxID=151771 RepID=UPI00106C163C|nr:uncharacterized protein LOC114537970 [Dendronephthya gigantea]XP_028415727.1 uncharacterized protein LOC114539300 [Dendronephthya gigantea]